MVCSDYDITPDLTATLLHFGGFLHTLGTYGANCIDNFAKQQPPHGYNTTLIIPHGEGVKILASHKLVENETYICMFP